MTPSYIALHHSLTKDSGTVSWGAIRRYHLSKKYSDIGYHYGIELARNQYEIMCGRMPSKRGAHCHGLNNNSLGVCMVGNFTHNPPPPEQWTLTVKLVKYLREEFNIPLQNVVGHRDAQENRSCPGRMFDMGKFRADLLV